MKVMKTLRTIREIVALTGVRNGENVHIWAQENGLKPESHCMHGTMFSVDQTDLDAIVARFS